MYNLRSAIRPVVTLLLATATAVAAFIDREAFELLIGPATLVVTWWFKARDNERGQ